MQYSDAGATHEAKIYQRHRPIQVVLAVLVSAAQEYHIQHLMIPRGRGTLRRRSFDDLRQRTPTTSASTPHTHLRIGGGTSFLQHRRRRGHRSYHHPSSCPVPLCRITDAQMQDDKHLASLTPHASHSRAGLASTSSPTTSRELSTAPGGARMISPETRRRCPQPVRMS
ncbi:hypothetical protein B0H13DRAFT_1173579 [Mycena leptocephala]|nr:hypothetical protein B0H13DRAFT_1173579 [Mycena leptocephala]